MSEDVFKGNVLIASPNFEFAENIKKHLKKRNFKVFNVVVALEYLMESLDKLKEEGTEVDAIILTSDIGKKLNDKRLEFVADGLLEIREKYSEINIVLLANEKEGHPFLAEVVQMGIYNVFVKGKAKIDIDLFEEVIGKPKSFSYAAPFLKSSNDYRWRDKATSIRPVSNQRGEKDQEEKTEEKQEVVKKEINKQVVKRNYQINVQNNVEKVVGVPVDKKMILVGSPFSRSGSTFVSHLIARGLSKMGVTVTYVESPYSPAYSYDRFIGHEKNPEYRSQFYQYTKDVDPKKKIVFDWTLEDIRLVTKHPTNEPIYQSDEVPFDVFVKILLSSPSTVTIVDVGTDWHEEVYQDLRDIASKTYLVIEPDISNIQLLEDPDNEKTEYFRKMMKDEKNGLIGNRFDESIMKHDIMKDLFKDKFSTLVPVFPANEVFKSQYEGSFINDTKNFDKQISDLLLPVFDELLPKEFIKRYRKKNGLLSGLFNKKYSIERSDG
ncbi:hypothetical protein QTG56_22810 (plasmid) [Rossellomorea sp. AcN35-11]|nr:hypothetical protein [Rossellomorea aquimaris]WJV32202.1 hypothetical protein QTG56_22810 [Rossellomorea sp. AcN35-11]